MGVRAERYPPEAYAPNGVLWWRLDTHPGMRRRYGDELKLAAWLAFNSKVGDTFTMRELRQVLGTTNKPNTKEQLNRRLRNLRPDGWVVDSYRTARLPTDMYRLERIGWHPGLGTPRPLRISIPADIRRLVIDRDRRRCVVCSIAGGDPYPGEPHSVAVLTVGHRIPQARQRGVISLDALQTECQRCNETVRDEVTNPVTLAELVPRLRRLTTKERSDLLAWVAAGRRLPSRIDDLYDCVRMLAPGERESVAAMLREMLGLPAVATR